MACQGIRYVTRYIRISQIVCVHRLLLAEDDFIYNSQLVLTHNLRCIIMLKQSEK